MATKSKQKSSSGRGPKGRPQPHVPRAGVKVSGNRYGCGGKVKK